MAAFLSQLYQPDLTTMTMLALILPVLAIGTILWFTTRHLPLVQQTVIDVPWEKNSSHSRQCAYAFYLVVTKKLFPCLMFVF